MLRIFLTVALAVAGVGMARPGRAQSGKVTVVTSFNKDVTDPIKKAF